MRHNLKVSVRKSPASEGVVQCKRVCIREKILQLLFGDVRNMTIIIPGNTVDAMYISEVPGGGALQ